MTVQSLVQVTPLGCYLSHFLFQQNLCPWSLAWKFLDPPVFQPCGCLQHSHVQVNCFVILQPLWESIGQAGLPSGKSQLRSPLELVHQKDKKSKLRTLVFTWEREREIHQETWVLAKTVCNTAISSWLERAHPVKTQVSGAAWLRSANLQQHNFLAKLCAK